MNRWSEEEAAFRLRLALAPKALEKAEGTTEYLTEVHFPEVMNQLAKVFVPTDKVHKATSDFELRTKKPKESWQDYVLGLIKLYKIANPGEIDDAGNRRISRQFILGCHDRELALYLRDKGECEPLELASFAERRDCHEKELDHLMIRSHSQEADPELGLMAFRPPPKKGYQGKPPTMPTVEQIAEKVCSTMGTKLLKGLESRLDKFGQKFDRSKRKPGPWKKKPDGAPKGSPSKTSSPTAKADGDKATQKSENDSGNAGRLPREGEPPRQPGK